MTLLNNVLEIVSFSLHTHIKCHELILIACLSSAVEAEDATSQKVSFRFFQCEHYCYTTYPNSDTGSVCQTGKPQSDSCYSVTKNTF